MVERQRVLVVDDDPEFLAFVRDGLVGFDPVLAQTPLEAMWLLEHHEYHAVVCDLVFGEIDGCHLLELVRERWPASARVLVTGFAERLDRARTFPAAQAVVHKPCDLRGLDQLLTSLG